MKKSIYIICVALLLVSCDYFYYSPRKSNGALARVNDVYLYEKDITGLKPKSLSKEDSTIFVSNLINRWATQQLLEQGAGFNLDPKRLAEFDRLAKQYRSDLYSKAYLEALVNKNLDTLVGREEAFNYYKKNMEAFRLNENLINLRYVSVNKKRKDLKFIKKAFKRYNGKDMGLLDSLSIHFKSYSLRQSLWIRTSQAIARIPVLTTKNVEDLTQESNYIELKDKTHVYLININNVLKRNSVAPLEYVKPTINQIVLNKRKLDLIANLEKEIAKDAIKKNQFEIY